jgi:hypothetical protein
MNTPTKLGGYAVVLAAVFAAATGVGNAVGPFGPTGAGHTSTTQAGAEQPSESERHGGMSGMGGMGEHDDAAEGGAAAQELPGGLMVSQDGYTLALAQDTVPAGEATPVSFQILGPDGAAVTGYDPTHDKDLHLIAVRRDMTGFQHVHPELDSGGRWNVPLALDAGSWKVFADFAPAGQPEAMTLGADISVAGDYQPQALPEPSTTAQVDGYTVTLDGELVPGQESELTLSVSRAGEPVTDLQPYLAAYGHLVALRDGDLAYLHVHPDGEPGDGRTEPGPDITFYATTPSAGDYRLFLDFHHEDVVRTAEFSARAVGTQAAADDHGSH